MRNFALILLKIIRILALIFGVYILDYFVFFVIGHKTHHSTIRNIAFGLVLSGVLWGFLGIVIENLEFNNSINTTPNNPRPNTDYWKANVYFSGNKLVFKKRMFHATKSLEIAREICRHNLWFNNYDLYPGIHFGDPDKASPTYGDYIIEVEITCPYDEISEDSSNSSARLVRMYDYGSQYHYFIPARKTLGGAERIRPSIVKPLRILKRMEDKKNV